MTRVLIVDDSTTVRRYHRKLVEAAACEVEEAYNGFEALERLLRSTPPFDLVLVDVNMPTMDGYTFLRRLRTSDGVADTPTVMISTEAAPLDRDRAYDAGANAYLVKPVLPDAIARIVTLICGPATP